MIGLYKYEKHWDSAYLRQGTSDHYRHPDTDLDPWSIRDPDRHQNVIILFTDPLLTFPENFMQIRSEVFAQVANRQWQTDKQAWQKTTTIRPTYPPWRRDNNYDILKNKPVGSSERRK